MKLDLTPLEDAVAQLEEALDIYHSDLALDHPRLKRHLRAAVIQAFEFTYELSFRMLKSGIWSLRQPIPPRSTSSSSTTLYVKPTGKLCSGLNSRRGWSFAGTVGRPATPTTKRKLRRCSRAFPTSYKKPGIS